MNKKIKVSRVDFLKMAEGAAVGIILTRLPHTTRRAVAQQFPPIIGTTSAQQEYSYLVYRVGSTYKGKNGDTGLIEFESTRFNTLMQNCRDSVMDSGGLIRLIPDSIGYKVDGTISFNASHTRMNIRGVSKHGTNLIPTGNFPVFEFTDCSYFMLKDLSFQHRINDYDTTPFVRINDHCSVCDIEDCDFADGNNTYKGIGIGAYVQTDHTATFLKVRDCFFNYINICFYMDSSGASAAEPWINGVLFGNNTYSDVRYLEKTNLKSGGQFSGNTRINEQLQADSNFQVGFDWDDPGSHTNNFHQNVFLWDINEPQQYYARLSPRDSMLLDGCSSVVNSKMDGSGWNNGARVLRRSTTTVGEGTASFSADGEITDFMIYHNLQYNPTNVSVTPMSKDAASAFYIYNITAPYIILRYLQPPPAAVPPGSKNIVLSWGVKA